MCRFIFTVSHRVHMNIFLLIYIVESRACDMMKTLNWSNRCLYDFNVPLTRNSFHLTAQQISLKQVYRTCSNFKLVHSHKYPTSIWAPLWMWSLTRRKQPNKWWQWCSVKRMNFCMQFRKYACHRTSFCCIDVNFVWLCTRDFALLIWFGMSSCKKNRLDYQLFFDCL